MSDSPQPCPACEVPHGYAFCPHCAFERRRAGLSWRLLLSDLSRHFASFDAPLWRTVTLLTTHPGAVAAAWLGGRRRGLVHPLKFCLAMGSAAVLVLQKVVGPPPPLQLPANVDASKARLAERAHEFQTVLQEWSHVLTFALLPLLGLLLRLFFRRARRPVIEHTAFTWYVFGQSFLFQALFTIVTGIDTATERVVMTAVPIVYFAWAGASFYGRPWWRSGLLALVADLTFYAVVGLIGIAAIMLLAAW